MWPIVFNKCFHFQLSYKCQDVPTIPGLGAPPLPTPPISPVCTNGIYVSGDWDSSPVLKDPIQVKSGLLVYPVIFAIKHTVLFSRSTFKLTTYLDFKPYLHNFQSY